MPPDDRWTCREPKSYRAWVGVAGAACHRLSITVQRWSPEWKDSLVYVVSAAFAGITAMVAGIPLYRQWGEMAVGPYAAAGLGMAVVGWRAGRQGKAGQGAGRANAGGGDAAPSDPGRPDMLGKLPVAHARRWQVARIVACAVVLAGATVVPLALEVIWGSEGNAAAHMQPEVVVVERAGVRVDRGQNPYQVIDKNGRILIHQTKLPVYELYYPYLPGMVLFGFSSGSSVRASLTDARIQFLLFTLIVTLIALSRLRPGTDARFRALQVLTVLPTAALPLATGGDDMPVVALMLLGMVAIQRRRPLLAGLALGAASSLKFTAWPLAFLAVWAALDRRRKRAAGPYLLGLAVVIGPVVLPLALRNPSAFIDNVIRFPLGLAGVTSPAASPLPGHLFVTAFPRAHPAYVLVAVVSGLAFLGRRLFTHPPVDASGTARLAGWVMLVAILLAPATRVGYLLYPANLFVWAWMLGRARDPEPVAPADDTGEEAGGRDRGVGTGRPGLRPASWPSPGTGAVTEVIPRC
ncbi:MAG: glycosyltransferase 87 family protein [Acidimicrobiales bacterium]